MHRALIVANRTVGGDELAEEVRRRLESGTCEFHLLVPVASPVNDRSIAPVVPVAAASGAVTVMLPASVAPSSQVCSLNGVEPTTPQPCTTAV